VRKDALSFERLKLITCKKSADGIVSVRPTLKAGTMERTENRDEE